MYNLIEYNSNYSEATASLWCYSKEEASNFNADIAKTKNFKSFKYQAKLLGNTVAQTTPNQDNGILENAAVSVPLKYLSNFWRTLKMSLVNWKNELKIIVLSENGNVNVNDNDNATNIIFTITDTKLYVPVVNLLARDNQKLSKLLSKGFKRSVYWNENKAKSENENTINEYRFFLISNLFEVNRLFDLVYSYQDNDFQNLKVKDITYQKKLLII